MQLQFTPQRRKTIEVRVGNTTIGGNSPIRIQSMANTDTNDIEASVEQAKRIIDAGGELVRFTTQGIKEAESLNQIRQTLLQCEEKYARVPIVADVHFNANVADCVAQYVEKVRINPGNYVDPARTFKQIDYSDAEYADEIAKIEERFSLLLNICKQHHTAIRLGVNHGSLSDRIMSRYGDTPEGMVESVMEFLRVCKKADFNDIVISIKASNTRIMVTTVRMLIAQMDKEQMAYPLHLGVTEAGDGEDGRIKSALGIGALLADGIGDTIRVSLSEAPEKEIPVAKELVDYFSREDSDRYSDERIVTIDDKDNHIFYYSDETNRNLWQLHVAADCGKYLLNGDAKEVEIINPNFSHEECDRLRLDILQAARLKMTKTEYISCPSCGRTLFDLEQTIHEIKQATSHLKGLKIGIMGCIVNGPGEMADADYGYVGAGRGRISLYKGKECVLKNIPQEDAVAELVRLIKDNGDWKTK